MKCNRFLCWLILTVVFLISTAALSDVMSLYLERKADNPLSETRYEFVFKSEKADVFDEMMNNLPADLQDYKELQIRSAMGIAIEPIKLVAFIPDICEEREEYLYSGNSIRDLKYGELYFEDFAATDLHIDYNADRVTFFDNRYDLCGVGAIIDGSASSDDLDSFYTCVYCTPEMFFEIANKFQAVVFQFHKPLSAREEAELTDYMNSMFEITEYNRPYGLDDYGKQEVSKTAFSAVIILAACLVCTAEIVDFYLSLFDTERKVRRLCGASDMRMFTFDALKMLQLSLIAIAGGYLLAMLMNLFEERFFNGVLYDIRFILLDVAVFIVLATVIWAGRTILRTIRHEVPYETN